MTRREEENFSRHHREWDSSGAQHSNAPVAAHIRGWHCTSGRVGMELVVAKAFAGSRQQVVREFLLTLSLVGKTLVVIKEGGTRTGGELKQKEEA